MSMNSEFSYTFERVDFRSNTSLINSIYESVLKERKICNYQQLSDAVNNLTASLYAPPANAHPLDEYTFKCNGKSFMISWKSPCYSTHLGVT